MRRLFILRPEPSASATVREAQALGLDAVAMPLFALEPVAWNVPSLDRFDGLLLTSANAVRCGGEALGRLARLPVHAVGEATAGAARNAGFEIASVGDSGVEGLLASIAPELRLLHLCGEQRIAVDAKQAITEAPVYRATELAAPARLRDIEGQVVAIHSPRAGARLAALAGEEGVDRGSVRIAAISPAAASAVGDGWELREAADRPDSTTLLALAARLCDNRVRP